MNKVHLMGYRKQLFAIVCKIFEFAVKWILAIRNKADIISSSNKITYITRGGSRTAATSKMEHFVIIVKGFQLLTIIPTRSILDVAAILDPPLVTAIADKKIVSVFCVSGVLCSPPQSALQIK